jgi:hypothetical protein
MIATQRAIGYPCNEYQMRNQDENQEHSALSPLHA